MAINFPATAGQATDGTFTYTVAGITYAWNGSSWAAAGAGASATNRSLFSVTTNSPSGGGALSYDQNSGAFSYTPPVLSGFLTAESDTLATITARGASTANQTTFTGGVEANVLNLTTNGINLTSTNDIGVSATGLYINNTSNNSTIASFQFNTGCQLRDTNGVVRLYTQTTGATSSTPQSSTFMAGPTSSLPARCLRA